MPTVQNADNSAYSNKKIQRDRKLCTEETKIKKGNKYCMTASGSGILLMLS